MCVRVCVCLSLTHFSFSPRVELTSPEAFLGVKLHLSREGKAYEPDLANVLQALAVRGDLQRKIKQFGKQSYSVSSRPVSVL